MTCTLTAEQIKSVKPLGFLHNKGTNCFNGRVITVNGKITAKQIKVVAEAAEKYGNGDIEFTTRLTIEVRGIDFNNIEPFRNYIATAGLQTGGTGTLVRPVVACKGTTCQYGLIDTFALSETIHERFYLGYRSVKLPHKFKIAVGGCPNNCVKPDLNDLGIIGQRIPTLNEDKCKGCKKCLVETSCPMKAAKVVDDKLSINKDICNNCGRCVPVCPFKAIDSEYGYQVYVGGRWGKKVARGIPLTKIFTSEQEVLDIVEKAILFFKKYGIAGERLNDTVNRIGFEEVEKILLSNVLLEEKQEILEA